jgi:hypothetical protein
MILNCQIERNFYYTHISKWKILVGQQKMVYNESALL